MQTWAIIVDTWRLLKARRLFWTGVLLSSLIGAALLSIDFTSTGWRLGFGWLPFESEEIRLGLPAAEGMLFGYFDQAVNWWLTFFGIILALITTASIIPEMLSPGSIEWMASKPISRWRLYLTKYFSALLVVFIQTVIVAASLWIAVKWRLGFWHHAIWWTVPLVLLIYSSLYCVTAWVGTITRSALSALLVTLLGWAAVGSLQFAERLFGQLSRTSSATVVSEMLRLGDETAARQTSERLRKVATVAMAILPKTSESATLTRRLIERQDDGYGRDRLMAKKIGALPEDLPGLEKLMAADRKALRQLEKHPLYIVVTSLIFQGFFLVLGCWRISRRDC